MDYGGKQLDKFTGYLYLNNENSNNENSFKTIKITGNNFIPSGSIVKSKHIVMLVTSCGNDRKCGIQKKNVIYKSNEIDSLVGKYMIQINLKLLLFKVLFVSCYLLFSLQNKQL